MNRTTFGAIVKKRGSAQSYIIGLVLAAALTVLAFVLATVRLMPAIATVPCICGAAVLQILVHLRFFLHLDASRPERWNVLSLVFAVFIIVMFVAGTIWVMNDLNYRMM